MNTLLDAFKAQITPAFIEQAAARLGERQGAVAKAVAGLAPTLLAGLMGKMQGRTEAVQTFQRLGDPDAPEWGQQLPGIVFGAKMPAVVNALAAFSGARADSVAALLGSVVPVVAALLRARLPDPDADGLARMLLEEKDDVLAALPTGMASIIDLPAFPVPPAAPPSERHAWLAPFLLLAGLGGGLLWYLKGC